MSYRFQHIPVMTSELVTLLSPRPGGTYVDCTGGGGGHISALLECLDGEGKIIALDRDPDAIRHLSDRFANEIAHGQLIIKQTAFSQLRSAIGELGLHNQIDGIYADIGVSSHQIDTDQRGFAFSKDGPLDMRMDYQGTARSAADLVNQEDEEELTRIFRFYGEVPFARPLARAIVRQREINPIQTTRQLFAVIERIARHPRGRGNHPAAQVFQALRIAVNDELNELSQLLLDGFALLSKGGRLCCISFHSLEDRLVKQYFLRLDGRTNLHDLPRELPLQVDAMAKQRQQKGTILKPFPAKPSDDEIELNPRARSARLRGIEKH
jgi:16S rRNA (cytosine1402-N4)-methyltransferase